MQKFTPDNCHLQYGKCYDSVTREAIRHQVLPSFSIKTTNKLKERGCKKRKPFEENELSEFIMVDNEELGRNYKSLIH